MDAEYLIKVGACPVHLGQVEVVNHYGQRKLAEVISVQLDLLDGFAELLDLAFFRIVEEHVLCGGVVETDLARERPLGIVKMAPFGLDDATHFAGIFFFPFRDDVIVCFDFQQVFEDERKALGGRLLERQNLDVVVIHTQMPAVAFERRFGKVVVEEGVVFKLGAFEFIGMEVERSLENAKGFVFVEHPDSKEVTDLDNETADFLEQRRMGIAEVFSEKDGLLVGGEMRSQIGEGFLGILRKLGKRASQFLGHLKSLVQDRVIDGKGKQRVGLAVEIRDTVPYRRVYDGIGVQLVGYGLVVALEEVLVDTIVFIEQLQGRFEPLRETIKGSRVEALIVNAANFEDGTYLPGLCEKDLRPDKAVEVDLLAEAASLVVVLEDPAKPEHGYPFGSQRDRTSWGRIEGGVFWRSAKIAESADRSGWPSGPSNTARETSATRRTS